MKNDSLSAKVNQDIYNQNWTDWLDLQLYGPKIRWMRQLIFACLKDTEHDKPQSILDVGCGEGTTSYFIAKKYADARIDGIDFSLTGITNAKERWVLPNLNFFHDQSLERLTHNYDMLCSFEVLEHIEDWCDMLKRFSACADKYITLTFPVGKMRAFEPSVGHLRNFKKGEVETCLIQQGFVPLKIFYAGFPFYSPLYRNLCELFNSPYNSFARGKYGLKQKVFSQIFYILFRFFSTKRRFGEQFCGVFRKK